MAKYVCDKCQKKFVHPAKIVDTTPSYTAPNMTTSALPVVSNQKSLEYTVCPFCQALEYSEFVDPQPEITSVVSVDLADVDAKLQEGYIVESLYAKTATLVKREVKTT